MVPAHIELELDRQQKDSDALKEVKKNGKKNSNIEQLSEEDEKLKAELEMLVDRFKVQMFWWYLVNANFIAGT